MAVTFNQGSNSLSVIDSATLSVQDVEVRGNLNNMKLSPDGNWVVCYHDLNGENGGQGTGGAISYNAISIVNLETLEHTEAMAGAFPKDVQFSGDSSLGVVISDDYLSTIDFTQTPPALTVFQSPMTWSIHLCQKKCCWIRKDATPSFVNMV